MSGDLVHHSGKEKTRFTDQESMEYCKAWLMSVDADRNVNANNAIGKSFRQLVDYQLPDCKNAETNLVIDRKNPRDKVWDNKTSTQTFYKNAGNMNFTSQGGKKSRRKTSKKSHRKSSKKQRKSRNARKSRRGRR